MLAGHVGHYGIILKTERFEDCIAFYRDRLGLPVWFEKPGLVCLRFGTGYLMIEKGGVAQAGGKSTRENPTVLRFNVEDVDAVAAEMTRSGIAVAVHKHDWGTIASFADPDGNPCELKNEDRFFM